MLNLIINLASAYFLYIIVNLFFKRVFGKSIIQILHELNSGKSLMEVQKEALEADLKEGKIELDYHKLFVKLCKVSDKTPLEICLTARTEKGFSWEDKKVEDHYITWAKYGFKETELPTYLESFLYDGKEYIINS